MKKILVRKLLSNRSSFVSMIIPDGYYLETLISCLLLELHLQAIPNAKFVRIFYMRKNVEMLFPNWSIVR